MLFYLNRNSAHHKNDLIGMLRYILVHPSLHIGEAALHTIGTHTPASYLVCHEDESGILCGETVELLFNLS